MSQFHGRQLEIAAEKRRGDPDLETVITIRLKAHEHERFLRGAKLDRQSLNQWCLEAIRCWCDSAEEFAREKGKLP